MSRTCHPLFGRGLNRERPPPSQSLPDESNSRLFAHRRAFARLPALSENSQQCLPPLTPPTPPRLLRNNQNRQRLDQPCRTFTCSVRLALCFVLVLFVDLLRNQQILKSQLDTKFLN